MRNCMQLTDEQRAVVTHLIGPAEGSGMFYIRLRPKAVLTTTALDTPPITNYAITAGSSLQAPLHPRSEPPVT
jgi:hypothetical protein